MDRNGGAGLGIIQYDGSISRANYTKISSRSVTVHTDQICCIERVVRNLRGQHRSIQFQGINERGGNWIGNV